MRNWLLPEYIEDILPVEARHIELMRRKIIDLLFVHGYQQVMPPLLEYVESLLTGSGSDMDLRIFKVIDQLSGRMMGLRADMTPQAARIDAHLLNCDGITRLCYANSVLHAVPCSIMQTREPLQIGAELYGHSGLESDLEIQQLMLLCLSAVNINQIHLDLGHVGVFRALVKRSDLSNELEAKLFAVLQAKDIASLKEISTKLKKNAREALLLLPELYGDKEVLKTAEKHLPDYPEVIQALNELTTIEKNFKSSVDKVAFDLSDLRGYHYHTGIVFAAYTQGSSNAVAMGGRYDEVGKAFGRARPATGFSMDLRALSRLNKPQEYPKAICAPFDKKDKELDAKITELRRSGQIVIVDLPGKSKRSEDCGGQLIHSEGKWIVQAI